VSYRYTTPQENEEIIVLYRTGEYSYQQIADMKNLSKGTVINIVKGYPYGVYKQVYSKLQDETAGKLEEAIKEEEAAAQKAYERGNYAAYGNHMQRWIDLLNVKDGSYETLKLKRLEYEQEAWATFADMAYEAFGYYAETWDVLTDIIGDNAKDPWGVIVKESGAKGKSKSVKYSFLDNVNKRPVDGGGKNESNSY
jgi:transposase